MYNNAAAATATGGLAMTGMTGLAGNMLWLFLTAFALLALGMALLRTIPRREE